MLKKIANYRLHNQLKEKNIVSMLIHVLNAHQVISCTLFH